MCLKMPVEYLEDTEELSLGRQLNSEETEVDGTSTPLSAPRSVFFLDEEINNEEEVDEPFFPEDERVFIGVFERTPVYYAPLFHEFYINNIQTFNRDILYKYHTCRQNTIHVKHMCWSCLVDFFMTNPNYAEEDAYNCIDNMRLFVCNDDSQCLSVATTDVNNVLCIYPLHHLN